MKHIINLDEYFESKYWGTIAAGIVPFCTKTKRFLVGLRSSQVREPGTYGSFGGKLDIDEGIDEEIKEAAIRELIEETEYRGEIHLIDGYVFRDGDFEYHNFWGLVDEEFTPELNWENDNYKWVTLEQLQKMPKKHFGLKKFMEKSIHLLYEYV